MSDDEIEEMVRDAICLHALDKGVCEAALVRLGKPVAAWQLMKELGLLSVDDLDNEAAA